MDKDELFAGYHGRKIAIYGLGTETQRVLSDFEDRFEMVGILDGFREEGEMYGKAIIPFEEAVKNGVELIIVAARPGSCKAIAKRIGNRCRECGIALLDLRGKDLLARTKIVYDFSDVNGVTKVQLRQKIADADVVSFDFFDTLVMRQTLDAVDVIEHVESKLVEMGIFLNDFVKIRMEGEKVLSRKKAPRLIEIYQFVLEKAVKRDVLDVTAKILADIEWQTDTKLMVPRKEICDFFHEAARSGKKVYIVSDTYYGKGQLAEILEKFKISGYVDILSSSDYGIGKQQGLYEILKRREPGKKYLHIGDDIVTDVESAQKHNFITCRLMSAADLFESTGNLGFGEEIESLSDRLKIGILLAKIFNSPFWFEKEDRRIGIADVYDIGYLICAPIICDFVLWFYRQIEEQQLHNIWLGARDGYLIKKMYMYLSELCGQKDESIYFLISRIAAVRAGVCDKCDIEYVDNMRYSGTLDQNLKERFGIIAEEALPEDAVDEESGLMYYQKLILEKAKEEYRNYQKYIQGLSIREGDIAFFDFVAKGTSQMYLQKLVHQHLKGFYFLWLEAEEMKDKGIEIQSFYGSQDVGCCMVYEDYYILETLLTAPHPSVIGFNKEGVPLYGLETRKDRDLMCFMRAQEGILDYFKEYVRLCPPNERVINRKLDEVFLGLIHKFRITDRDFLNLVVEDTFFNRMTNITDVL